MRALVVASCGVVLALAGLAGLADAHPGALAFWKVSVGETEARSQLLVPLAAIGWLPVRAGAGTDAGALGAPGEARLRSMAARLLPHFEVVEDGRSAPATVTGVRLLTGDMIEVAVVHSLRRGARGRTLRSSYHLLNDDGHQVVGRVEHAGGSSPVVFTAAAAEHPLRFGEPGGRPAPTEASRVGMVGLGLEHIVTGYDHVLFLLCLLVPGGTWRSRLAIVTAFTIAHSLTLALAALQIVSLPPRFVEVAIAGSLVYVAVENLLLDGPRARWPIAFGFGLLHGFGFAGQLELLHLPARDLLASLVAFNAGIEIGQIAIVLMLAPALAWIVRQSWHRRLVQSSSVLVCGLAAWWVLERLA
jgi:hypothetical protein